MKDKGAGEPTGTKDFKTLCLRMMGAEPVTLRSLLFTALRGTTTGMGRRVALFLPYLTCAFIINFYYVFYMFMCVMYMLYMYIAYPINLYIFLYISYDRK